MLAPSRGVRLTGLNKWNNIGEGLKGLRWQGSLASNILSVQLMSTPTPALRPSIAFLRLTSFIIFDAMSGSCAQIHHPCLWKRLRCWQNMRPCNAAANIFSRGSNMRTTQCKLLRCCDDDALKWFDCRSSSSDDHIKVTEQSMDKSRHVLDQDIAAATTSPGSVNGLHEVLLQHLA